MDENLLPVLSIGAKLDAIGCRWLLAGSLASSVRGVPRATMDADIVADLRPAQIKPLIEALGSDWYVDELTVREAVAQRSSFNLIELESGMKVDVFAPQLRRFDGERFARAERMVLVEGSMMEIPVSSAEDIVAAKLEWYRLGQEVSDRQWNDILTVLKANAGRLDLELLKASADELGVLDLLMRALKEAKL